MKNYNLYRFITVITAVLLFCSCSDFLMEKPKDFNDPDQWYKTDQNIISSVNGIYAQLRTGDYYGQKFPFSTEAFAGSWDAKGTDYTKFQFIHSNRNVFAQDNVLGAIWKTLYQTIGMANTTVDRINASTGDLTSELRTRIVAEARFLRALTYFNLVRCWEEIPLRKNRSTSFEDPSEPAASINDVYEFILEDLKYAEENLWNRGESRANYINDIGRATKLAAQMLYAQVYLTLASSSRHSTETRNSSYKTFNAEECYNLALEWTNKAIESSDFFFAKSWNDLWGVKNKGNKEIILATGFIGQINYGSNYFSMMTPKYSEFNGPQGSGFMSYGEFLYKAWKDAPENINVDYEPRLRDGIIREWKHVKQGYTVTWNDSKPHYEYTNNNGKVVNYEGNNEPMGPRCAKWIDTDAKILGTSALEFPIMRSAELYLMRAEILAEISGDPADGFADYNKVRERGNPAHPFDASELATYTGANDIDKFLSAILRERTAEMAGEGHFWFDCKRMDKLDDVTLQYSQKARYRELDYDMYWPYPQIEIDTNKKLEQKSAYKSA